MRKAYGLILTAGLVLGGGLGARGQMGGLPPDNEPPMVAALKKEWGQLMKEEDPQLYEFQEKIQGIDTDIGKVLKNFAAQEIDKDEARAELLPLIRERRDLTDAPEYLVEMRLADVILASPECKAKINEMTAKYAARKRVAATKAARAAKAATTSPR